jgi:cytochrome c-type biogenesis protein CcmH/NrfF
MSAGQKARLGTWTLIAALAVAVGLAAGAGAAAMPASQPAAEAAANAAPPSPEAARLLGPPAGGELAGEKLRERTDEVAARLRCVVCQGLSVAESPAPMAQQMKAQVRDLLAAGYAEPQVMA